MKEYKKKRTKFHYDRSRKHSISLDINVRMYICSTMHANFLQPRQKLTLCTGLPSPKVSRCTRQLRCQTTSNELRVVFVHGMLPTCTLHFSRLITFHLFSCLVICHNKNAIYEKVFYTRTVNFSHRTFS